MSATFYERGREGTEKGAPLVGGERKRRRAYGVWRAIRERGRQKALKELLSP